MADPRKASTNRVGTNPKRILTYKIDGSDITFESTVAKGSSKAGLAVTLSGAGIVRLVGDAGSVLGKLLHVEPDGYCAVQQGGTVELPAGDGATLTPGFQIVGDLGGVSTTDRGYIRNVAPATLAEVAVAAHVVEDAADLTKVQVTLTN